MLKILSSIPDSGIAAFVNEQDKSVYIIHSKELPIRLCREIKDLKENNHKSNVLLEGFKANTLSLVILEDVKYNTDGSSLSLTADLGNRYNYHMSIYRNSGYSDMRDGYNPGSFKIKTYINEDFRCNYRNAIRNSDNLVYVIGRSIRQDRIVMGAFEKMYEAEEWIKKTYPNGVENQKLIRASNALSNEYFKWLKTYNEYKK